MKAILALEDGSIFHGTSFTGPGTAGGEAIFNTGMSGYQEVLTDPSYAGQMVCMTYPLIGNYGVNLDDVESSRVWVEAFIVKECCKTPSNWRSKESLPQYLKRHKVMGLEGVDTRALTRHLRLHGAMRGVISTEGDAQSLVDKARNLPTMEGQGLAHLVTAKTPYVWRGGRPQPVQLAPDGAYAWPGPGPRVVAYDFGMKWNILRLLEAEGMDVLAVPQDFTFEQVQAVAPDAIFLGNGPGDPAALAEVVRNVALMTEHYPMCGICLGHQLLGLALGCPTFKLKFGHHGCNHPVKDLTTGKIEISVQNHGFCVDVSGRDDLTVTHVNLNDGTLEGFAHKTKPIICVQHHPEACPGPHDSRYIFKRFRRVLEGREAA